MRVSPFGEQPVDAIILWLNENQGGWHASLVLCRTGEGRLERVSPWVEPWGLLDEDPERVWTYFSAKVGDGGGNGITYELEGFSVAEVDAVAPYVHTRAAEVAAATHGPHGEAVGTINVTDSGVQSMPFVVLRDERGYRALVAAYDGTELLVVQPDGQVIEPLPFRSSEHWQRIGAPSWPIAEGVTYDVVSHHNRVQVRLLGSQLEWLSEEA